LEKNEKNVFIGKVIVFDISPDIGYCVYRIEEFNNGNNKRYTQVKEVKIIAILF
jgi:hypothetical protein